MIPTSKLFMHWTSQHQLLMSACRVIWIYAYSPMNCSLVLSLVHQNDSDAFRSYPHEKTAGRNSTLECARVHLLSSHWKASERSWWSHHLRWDLLRPTLQISAMHLLSQAVHTMKTHLEKLCISNKKSASIARQQRLIRKYSHRLLGSSTWSLTNLGSTWRHYRTFIPSRRVPTSSIPSRWGSSTSRLASTRSISVRMSRWAVSIMISAISIIMGIPICCAPSRWSCTSTSCNYKI